MRQVAGRMRLDLAQFRELAAFAQFASDLDPATKRQIDRGQRLTEILKQPQYQPMPVEEQVAIIWASTNGIIDDVPVEQVRDFESQYLDYLRTSKPELLERIVKEKRLSDELIADLQTVSNDFKSSIWSAAVAS
jgi:F-type H+-transporting ATPase subunit alpha